jgi:hypothetical protein
MEVIWPLPKELGQSITEKQREEFYRKLQNADLAISNHILQSAETVFELATDAKSL